MGRGVAHCAGGRARGGVDRDVLLQVMGGTQSCKRDFKRHAPCRAGRTKSFEAAWGAIARKVICLRGNLLARALALGSTFLLSPPALE
eukprot:7099450-Pyramimonas_sp.AAC.1